MTEDKQKKGPQPLIKGYAANQVARVRNEGQQDIAEGYNARIQVQTRNEPAVPQASQGQRQGEKSAKQK